MKSLKESLFDRDLVEKAPTFGDMYKPVSIYYDFDVDTIKLIGKEFSLSKLKKNCSPTNINLEELGCYWGSKTYFEFMPYLLTRIDKTAQDLRVRGGEKLTNLFKEFLKSKQSQLKWAVLDCGKELRVFITIPKTEPSEYYRITIKYEER